MPLIATCPSCQQSYQVEERFAGQSAKCRACGQKFVVPQPLADDPFAAAAAMQSSLASVPGGGYSFPPASHSASPGGGGAPGYGAAAYSAATGGSSGGFSTGEPVEWAIKPGIICSILGVGGLLLPLLGVQFRILAVLGMAAPIVAGLLALAGAVLLFLGLKDNLLKALPASGGVLVLALGAFVVGIVVENFNNPAVAQPQPAPGPTGVRPGGPQPNGLMPVQPQPGQPQPGIPQPGQLQTGQPQNPLPQIPRPAGQRQFAAGEPLDVKAAELPPLELGSPTTSLPKLPDYQDNQLTLAGNERTKPDFSDRGPAGSWLVGLRVVQSRNWDGAVCGIQPIYQLEGRYIPGPYCGVLGGVQQVLLLAKPGFAVSTVQVQSGLAMNALQLEFRQVKGQAMVPDGTYLSEWVGCEGGGLQPLLDGQGQPIVGLDGTFNKDLTSLRSYFPSP